MKITSILISFIVFISLTIDSHAQETDIPSNYTLRKALDFPDKALPDMDDEAFLGVLAEASKLSGLEQANKINIELYKSDINFIYHSDEGSLFITCHFHGSDPHCLEAIDTNDPMTEFLMVDKKLLFSTTLDMSIIENYELDDSSILNAKSYFIYASVAVTGYYGAKKVFNKLTTGKWRAGTDHHSHFFKTLEEAQDELHHLSEFVHQLGHEIEDGLSLQGPKYEQLFKGIAEDIFETGLELAKESAHCAHGHCHHHGAEAAHNAVMKHHKNFAIDLAIDFYQELVAPAVRLTKGMGDRFNRKQLWQFIELVAIKSVKERGVIPSVATGVFVTAGQVVAETVESLIMPAGVHVLCQVGNAMVMGIAATAYTGYFCLKNLSKLKGLKFTEKWRVIGQSLKIQWQARSFTERSAEKLALFSREDKFYLSLRLMQINSEKQLRYARNLEKVTVKESRKMAAELGELQKQLDVIGLHLRASQYRDDPSLDQQILSWYQKVHELQEKLPHGDGEHHHHHHQGPVLKDVQIKPLSSNLNCTDLLFKLTK